jgi:hypothetical protein
MFVAYVEPIEDSAADVGSCIVGVSDSKEKLVIALHRHIDEMQYYDNEDQRDRFKQRLTRTLLIRNKADIHNPDYVFAIIPVKVL